MSKNVRFCAGLAAGMLVCVIAATAEAYMIVSQGLGKSAYTASSSWDNFPPELAFDGNLNTNWNAGTYPVSWIEVNLGKPTDIAQILLSVEQLPHAARTTHEVWASASTIGQNTAGATLAHTLSGTTHHGQLLSVSFSAPLIAQYIQIRTTNSPSWVAWDEILILSPDPADVVAVSKQKKARLSDLRLELGAPLDESLLVQYSSKEIVILRNSIFAQYGRRFKSPWLRHYFEKQQWYSPNDSYTDKLLSPIDRKNAELLKAYEDRGSMPDVPSQYTIEQVVFEGLCEEVNANGETERYMFDDENKLEYEKEVNGKIIDKREGLWSVNKRTVSYRFSSGGTFRYLQPVLGKHVCRHVTQP